MATKDKKTKQVRLHSKYRELTYSQKIVPELKLSGIWLEELGFKPGELVRITTREQLLIIEPLKD